MSNVFFNTIIWLTVGIFYVTPAWSLQLNCSDLKLDVGEFADQHLYAQNTDGSWRDVQNLGPAYLSWRKLKLIYVAKQEFGGDRSGILVVKTGRTLMSGETDTPSEGKPVRLQRRESHASSDLHCPYDFFGRKSVSAASYDAYHDHDLRPKSNEDRETLRNFHTNYIGRRSACKASNNADPDSYARLDWRSNRTQFSFDPAVVALGPYSLFLDLFRPNRLGSANLADQKAEIIRYKTEKSLACVRITTRITDPGNFLRINDLESASSQNEPSLNQNAARSTNEYTVRSREQSWEVLK